MIDDKIDESFSRFTKSTIYKSTYYRFLVRAENSHGMSPPSSMTDRVRTLRAPRVSSEASEATEVDLDALHDVLLNKV